MAPPKENFLAPPLSILVCLSFLPRRMLCIILSLKLPCQVFLVGDESKDESNGQEYLWLPCRVFWWA